MLFGRKLLILFCVGGVAVRVSHETAAGEEAAFTPVATEACVKQGHFLETEAAYFAALKEADNVVNLLLEVDLTTLANDSSGPDGVQAEDLFAHWYQGVGKALEGLAQYPAFHSIVSKAKNQSYWPHIWCPTTIDVSKHLSLHTLRADDPHKDVLSALGDSNYGPYFQNDVPRWQAQVYRYVTGDGKSQKTQAVFFVLRTGHMLGDGISLVSMLMTSFFNSTWPKTIPGRDHQVSAPASADIPAEAASKRPVQVGRFDVSMRSLKAVCKQLSEAWSLNKSTPIKVTVTTLVETAVLRVMSIMKGKSGVRIAMPRDERAGRLNRARNVTAFKEVTAEYAKDILAWGRTNWATGAAHQVRSGCRGADKTLEGWQLCYMKMKTALGSRVMGSAQDLIEKKMSVRLRAIMYPMMTKAVSWMLSSMNAGPQYSTVAGAYVDSATIVMKPTNLFKRSLMLLSSGDRLSFGIMGPEASELTERLNQEMQELYRLAPER